MTIDIRLYSGELRLAWDSFVATSKNGTFLFCRDYVEYHRDRFVDHSLVVFDGQRILALLPANRVDDQLHSHGGLTYGGFITSEAMTTQLMLQIFEAVSIYLRDAGIRSIHYKTIPSIYHSVPAEEDRYALFIANASLYRRDVLSVVRMSRRPKLQERRRRGVAKAERAGVTVGESDDWVGYWSLLSGHLESRFATKPVHSLQEIRYLKGAFPGNIALYTASLGDELLAGVVIYFSTEVAHAQYIASSERGRELHALDWLFVHLLSHACGQRSCFDFGISNEQQGRILNRGLIAQKEGFGGRAVAQDFYRIDLDTV
ncbi:GNAT family N-acetyltransferase [Bradyrhizobium sp. S69]|uniref:GNAT family N-acetyltransferase n=1 Tax=Bradyrhizobium sp. S69 TaxID=1641856 RepID=UPI00131C4B54|nr:GNAT family N-acetyltransferase [Bradyrhizobium sp. S69]